MITIEATAKLWMPTPSSQIQSEFFWPNHSHQAFLADKMASYHGFSNQVVSQERIVWLDGQPYGSPHRNSTLAPERLLPICEKFAVAAILSNLRGHIPGLLTGSVSLCFRSMEVNAIAADTLNLAPGIWKLGQSKRSKAWLELQKAETVALMPAIIDPSSPN